ncbi:MAG: hypothetical protein IJK32_03850 [Bacteroidales bacterium]|nr:hypothetical protein [Bacteroidales bacterium]
MEDEEFEKIWEETRQRQREHNAMLEQDPNWDKSIFDSPMLQRWIDGSDIVDNENEVDSDE